MTPYGVLLTGYLALLAASLLVEVGGRAGREPFRPLGDVLQAVLASPVARWGVWAAWVWIGVHFLAR